jgi:antitoxin ParD1/3/4
MGHARSIEVMLPDELARMVEEKVASGGYESAAEVVRDGLRALQARDKAVEAWLRTEGVARYEAYHRPGAKPGRPAAEVFAELRARNDAERR